MSRGSISHPRPARQKLSPAEVWAREEAAAKRRGIEDLLAQHIRAWGLLTPEREFRFDEIRRWRFDFAWPGQRVAAEVEGLTPPGADAGRHQRAGGYDRDTEKYNAAAAAGWKVLRFTPAQVRSAYAIRTIEAVLTRASREPGGAE